jgi:RhoGEF domain
MGNVTSVVEDLGLNEPDLSSSSANEQPDDSAAHKSLPAHKRWQTDRCYLPNELEKRKQAIEELLSSERNYVRHLGVLCDVFIQPLNCWADELQAQQEAAEEESGRVDRDAQLDVTRAELLTVFSNIEQLAAFNKQLLVELEAAEQAGGPKAMLDAFLKAAPFFKMYMVYVRNFELSRETLNALEGRTAVRIFLKACELQRACHGLQLRDLLITPVQRIPVSCC